MKCVECWFADSQLSISTALQVLEVPPPCPVDQNAISGSGPVLASLGGRDSRGLRPQLLQEVDIVGAVVQLGSDLHPGLQHGVGPEYAERPIRLNQGTYLKSY